MAQETERKSKRAIVAAVQRPSATDLEFEASLAELRQLAKTLGFEVVGTLPGAFLHPSGRYVDVYVMFKTL